MSSYKIDLELPESELPVSVEFTYTPGRPGTMYKNNGDPGDPPEDSSVDLESISVTIPTINHYGRRGKALHYELIQDLDQSVIDRITEQCDEHAVNDDSDERC